MKQLLLKLLFLLLVTTSVWAQSPQKFKFQAVARDASGIPYASENLAVRISLVRSGISGLIDYSERHEVTTSPLGVFDLEIGGGSILSGSFENLDWGNYPYYLKVDIDPNSGTDYMNLGTSQLLSVPYAIYAGQAGNGGGGGDPTDELQNLIYDPVSQTLTLTNGNSVTLTFPGGSSDDQVLDLNGTQLSIENGNTIDLAPIIPPGGTDDQQLSLNGTNLTIENGNSVNLAALQDGVNDADPDPNNEIQTLSKIGSTVTLSNGGGSFTDETNDPDADPSNELQILDLNGTHLSIS
ncbi:MAG: hypothetical protein MK078_18420, partial [Crocinitomicaceae bacterium]|nr:hypothetical protein [Crocinitomicaceae bacterium]